MSNFQRITRRGSRLSDRWGSGQFGAGRGSRQHQGLDLLADPGEAVFSPIAGTIRREALPYAGDARYRGIVITGDGEWNGYEVKLFYVEGLSCGSVRAGEVVGHAQDLSAKYPGITNHVHVEVRKDGRLLAPFEAFGACL